MTVSVMAGLILNCLEELSKDDFEKFKFYLNENVLEGCSPIPWGQLEDRSVAGVASLMKKSYSDKMVELSLEILKKISRNDLAERLENHLERSVGHRGRQTVWKHSEELSTCSGAADCDGSPVKKPRTMEAGSETEQEMRQKYLLQVQEKLKCSLKSRFEFIFEGLAKPGSHTLLNSIYTELYITEGDCEGVNNEHEVWQIETASRTQTTQDTAISCNDIFKPLPGQEKPIRTVLTKGIAGIGKTVSVQKFILDWAEGKANQDVDLMFVLPFRELNLIKDAQCSLLELLNLFHPEVRGIETTEFDSQKILFVFDGLDESRLNLNARCRKLLSDVTVKTSVDELLKNLVNRKLLPSALFWITTRPAAANQIPPECVHRVTEVRGFNDPQKEEYYKNRFRDQNLASRIISHIKSSRSLYIMCHMPVFCWISATVLERLLGRAESGEIPKTLTEMYTHFLLIQTNIKNQKYEDSDERDLQKTLESGKDPVLKLGRLAFQHLEKGNLIFYEEDLRECGIDVTEASVYSGVCTEIFKEECVLYQRKVYCFVHLSIQEFLAALYVLHAFTAKRYDTLKSFFQTKSLKKLSLYDLHRIAVQKAFDSRNGHLDLFLRFLLGLSLDSNQDQLRGLLTQTGSNSESIKKTVKFIKDFKRQDPSPERCINLFHCLSELKSDSLVKSVQKYLSSEAPSDEKISPGHCSALAYVLLMSEKVLDEFDLRKYNTTDEGRRRLVPAVKCCRKALLSGCNLTQKSCEIVASALQSVTSSLIELDLSINNLGDSGVELLCAGLKSPNCKLQTLDLSINNLGDPGVELLCAGLKSPNCKLQTLDLSNNNLGDSGVELLCAGLSNPHCRLQTLRLSGCQVTERGCASLASALRSNPSHLRELDLSYNHPGDSGVRALSAVLEDPSCELEKLNVDHGGEIRLKAGPRKYACQLTLDPKTAHRKLSLSLRGRRVTHTGGKEEPYPDHPDRFESSPQVLCREGLCGRCYWEAEWNRSKCGEVRIGMAYKGISRKGVGSDRDLGGNDKAWSLLCDIISYSARHKGVSTQLSRPRAPLSRPRAPLSSPPASLSSGRVGVYLDWPAGTLSFYDISSDTLTLLHTFHTTFTEPLYPGFTVYKDCSVSLCMLG